MKRPSSVCEVLAPEAQRREGMSVTNNCFGCIRHLARSRPASAEFPILAGGQGEARVETAVSAKAFSRDREVVGGEEAGAAMGRMPLVQIIDEELAGTGVRVGGQRVDRSSPDQMVASVDSSSRQGSEPAGLRQAVIVGEGEVIATGQRRARIPRGRGAGVGLPDQPHIDRIASGHTVRDRRAFAAVVDDDHLEAIRRVVERGERVETGCDARGTVVGWDDDREGRERCQVRTEGQTCVAPFGLIARTAMNAPVRNRIGVASSPSRLATSLLIARWSGHPPSRLAACIKADE